MRWLVDTRVFYDLDLQDISSNHPNSIRISIHASKSNVSFQIHNLSIMKAPVRSEGKVNIPAVCKRSTSSSSSSSSSSSFDNNNKPNNNDNKPNNNDNKKYWYSSKKQLFKNKEQKRSVGTIYHH